MRQKMGQVYLVGAGCGAADLITLRGLRRLEHCDAVVYDSLAEASLLAAVPPEAERYDVGKRAGCQATEQADISALLADLARSGKTVVRLKGGDPFVFGRGGEEALALWQAGIPWEAVPGVSSALAVPAEAGIPVTHRGVSQSVHIVAAHTADTPDGLPAELDQLARLSGTLVFLMGLGQLSRLAWRLREAGMSPETPVAVIANGAVSGTVRAPLGEIAERVRQAGLQTPAVIVVGGTAAMELPGRASGPLSGVFVGLTGTAAITDKLSVQLASKGAKPFLAARFLVEALPLGERVPAALSKERRRWLVFTSANGVRIFFQGLRGRLDLRRLHACRFAVIGRGTAEALAEWGFQADLCPETFTSAALGQALQAVLVPDAEVWLLRSALGSRELPLALENCCLLREIPIYTLRPDPAINARARSCLGSADYLVFSSASGVDLFFDVHGGPPEGTVCVCIGAVTARALTRRYAGPVLTAEAAGAQEMAALIEMHWQENHSP